jgi:pyrimidine deaminase RibD-like protein
LSKEVKNIKASLSESELEEQSILEARKSRSEDLRIHPCVGVVVAKDGKILAKSHRGELAKGDHGEYTALERKLQGRNLEGATLYTTLEPCTTRKHPKVPCARRIIDRRISRVVIGMFDPDSRIQGKGAYQLQRAGVQVALYSQGSALKILDLNTEFIKSKESEASNKVLPIL